MTRDELKVLIVSAKTIYGDKICQSQNAFILWYDLLCDIPYAEAKNALHAWMKTQHWAPQPSDIREYCAKQTDDAQTELTAWSQVRKAIRNGLYGAQEEFDKLDPLVQMAVGDPAALTEWAKMPSNEVESVAGSHFMRNYRAVTMRHREQKLIAPGLTYEAKPLLTVKEDPEDIYFHGESEFASDETVSRYMSAFRSGMYDRQPGETA